MIDVDFTESQAHNYLCHRSRQCTGSALHCNGWHFIKRKDTQWFSDSQGVIGPVRSNELSRWQELPFEHCVLLQAYCPLHSVVCSVQYSRVQLVLCIALSHVYCIASYPDCTFALDFAILKCAFCNVCGVYWMLCNVHLQCAKCICNAQCALSQKTLISLWQCQR